MGCSTICRCVSRYIMRNLEAVRCTVCQQMIKWNNVINIDISNGLSHLYCNNVLEIKDTGTYQEIADKYGYFSVGK
jgi:hypothetical protein